MPGREYAYRSVKRLAEVIAVAHLDGSSMEGHTHPHRPYCTPGFTLNGKLGVERSSKGVVRGREDGAEGIADRLKDMAIVDFYGVPE